MTESPTPPQGPSKSIRQCCPKSTIIHLTETKRGLRTKSQEIRASEAGRFSCWTRFASSKPLPPLETTCALLFFNVFPAKGKCQNRKMSFPWFIFASMFVSVLRVGKKKEQAVLWGIKGSWRKSELCSRNGRIHLCVAKGFNWLTETSGQPTPPLW